MGARQKLMQISNQLRSEVVRLNEGERKMREYIQGVDSQISSLEDQLVESETAEAAAIATVRPTEGPLCRAARAAFLIFQSIEPTKLHTPKRPV